MFITFINLFDLGILFQIVKLITSTFYTFCHVHLLRLDYANL